MFFSRNLVVPEVLAPLHEIDRDLRSRPRPVAKREFVA